MTQTRKSWSQEEQEEKEIILKRFWDERVNSPNKEQRENSLKNIKDLFLQGQPRSGISKENWKEELNKAWADESDKSPFKNENTFYSFFTHITSLKVIGYVENLMPTYNRESTIIINESLKEINKIPIEDYPPTNISNSISKNLYE